MDLYSVLTASLSHIADVRKPAESRLMEFERMPGFSQALFDLLKSNIDENVKAAAAIKFKNFVKRNWRVDDNNDDVILESDRKFVRDQIIELMVGSTAVIQKQLSEAVTIVARSDFPYKWESLLPQLVNKINERNFVVINGVLKTGHELFKRYRDECKSDVLWTEIKQVITTLGEPLTNLIKDALVLIANCENNRDSLNVLWNSVLFVCKIFQSLNHQDLPEFFEDNIKSWMETFDIILKYSNPLLNSTNKDEPGILEDVKTQICASLSLYAGRYEEEFAPFLSNFLAVVMQTVLGTNAEARFDNLVSSSLDFLSLSAEKHRNRGVFSSIDIQRLLEHVVLPNIQLRQCDLEMFNDNYEEYIRRDIEGSMAHTRRKSACDLIKSLCDLYRDSFVNDINRYVQSLLEQYSTNPVQNWKDKDCALFLVTSIASRGMTERLGVTTTNFIDVGQFYISYVLPELNGQIANNNPVVKADCVKYLMAFRNIIAPEYLKMSINLLAPFANHPSHVVHSYAAAAINKLLMVRDKQTHTAVITAADINQSVLVNLCQAFQFEGSEENDYSMQAIMRTLSCLKNSSLPVIELLTFLIGKFQSAAKNPKNPRFNHFLVESIALSIKIIYNTDPTIVTKVEDALHPIFTEVLNKEIEPFIPYVIQLLSLLLDYNSPQRINQYYINLFQFLLQPNLWGFPEFVPSILRLLISYLEKAGGNIITGQMPNLINIFERLNKSRSLDSFGFSLVTAVLFYLPKSDTEQILKGLFVSCFNRLMKNKTPKYLKGFTLFFCSVCLIFQPREVVAILNSIQENIIQMTLQSAVIPYACRMSENVEKKIVAVGLTKFIVDVPFTTLHSELLGKILELLVQFDPNAESINDAHFVDVDDALSNTTVLNQLMFVGKKVVDPATSIGDPRLFLRDSIAQQEVADGNKLRILVEALSPPVRNALNQMIV